MQGPPAVCARAKQGNYYTAHPDTWRISFSHLHVGFPSCYADCTVDFSSYLGVRMDKRVIIILVLVIALVAGVGAAILILTRQSTPPISTTPTPQTSSAPQSASVPAISTRSETTLQAGLPSSIAVLLDTKGVRVDGFQFIATIDGTSLPAVIDADNSQEGVQIAPAALPGFSVSTNSVTEQDGKYVVRFAMVLSDTTSQGYTTQGPESVATITVTPGTAGTISMAFNQQNARARLNESGDDVVMASTDGAFVASAQTSGGVAAAPATSSAKVTAAASTAPFATTPAAQTTTSSSPSPFCLATCFSDSDCAAGFVCETDRCVNPSCPTSQTCSCSGTTTAQASATPRATPVPTPVVAVSTATPRSTPVVPASVAPTATDSAEPLPKSGNTAYTILTIGAGLLLLGFGIVLTTKPAPVHT